jgi:hypothetical protein
MPGISIDARMQSVSSGSVWKFLSAAESTTAFWLTTPLAMT